MKRYLYISVVLAMLVAACTPQERAQRHIEKAIDHVDRARELYPEVATPFDTTITVDTTITIPGARFDTTIFLERAGLQKIETDRFWVKLEHTGAVDSLRVSSFVKPVTRHFDFSWNFRQTSFEVIQCDCWLCIPRPGLLDFVYIATALAAVIVFLLFFGFLKTKLFS